MITGEEPQDAACERAVETPTGQVRNTRRHKKETWRHDMS